MTYTARVVKSKINMKEASKELSANAFLLLNHIYYGNMKGIKLKDDLGAKYLKTSLGVYKNAKAELKEKNFIKIVQIKANHYIWYLGENSIKKEQQKYQRKEELEREKFAKLVLSYMFPNDNSIETPYKDTKEYNLNKENKGVFSIEI